MKTKAPSKAKVEVVTLRAFVALDLDERGLRRVSRLSDRLRMASGAPSAAWVPSSQMHVTLKFAGELPEKAVAPLCKALGTLIEGKRAPNACALRVDAFPSVEKASVVVAELVDAKGELAKLAEKVDKLTSKHGIALEKRKYRPHVTLARVRLEYDSRRWLRVAMMDVAGECGFSGVTLYKSILGAEGATYEPLGRWAYSTSTQTS